MREIIFRGKRIDNGEWVEGCLFVDDKGEKHEILVGYVNYRIAWEVNPETVGQYTGLTDKNGTKIFEGDIVKVKGRELAPDYHQPDRYYEVKYMLGQFYIGLNMPIAYKRFSCEVIGNIHDNPELLKGGVEK